MKKTLTFLASLMLLCLTAAAAEIYIPSQYLFEDYAPVCLDKAQIRSSQPGGLRFAAYVFGAPRAFADEYGFLVALNESFPTQNGKRDYTGFVFEGAEYDDDSGILANGRPFAYGVAYDREKKIDKVYSVSGEMLGETLELGDNGGVYISGVLIGMSGYDQYSTDIAARPYLRVGEKYYYGNTVVRNIYEMALALEADGYSTDFTRAIADSRPARTPRQAYRLCYTDSLNNGDFGIESGWEYDNRAGTQRMTQNGSNATVVDVMENASSALTRYFNTVTDDRIELRARVLYLYGSEGTALEFLDEDGTAVYRLFVENGAFRVELPGGTSEEVRGINPIAAQYDFRFVLDLEKGFGQTYINNVFCGEYPLLGDAVRSFAVTTSDAGTSVFNLQGVFAEANYAVYEDFAFTNGVPCDMTAVGNVSVSSEEMLLDGVSEVTRAFEKLSHRVAFGVNAYFADGQDGASFALTSHGADAVELTTSDGVLYAGDQPLVGLSDKLWYKLTVIADTDTGVAEVHVNGQKKAEVSLNGTFGGIDGIRAGNTAGIVRLDDIRVYNVVDTLVPAPVKPAGEEDYTVGINVCPMWMNGEHIGWRCITPYDDIKPVLGYYDEGLTETADWEIKYLAEHGVDFEAFCWFASRENEPMKTTRFSAALDEGYKFSAYSGDMDYCLIWEASNGARPASSAAFRNYYVPYLIENYFTDPRYLRLDGKLVFSVFGANALIDAFGTGLRNETDYLRAAVKEATGCDMILLACGSCKDAISKYGFDGWHTYSWGTDGNSLSVNRTQNLAMRTAKDVAVIPAVSVGFNNVAWGGTRVPLISVEDYTSALTWVRDTYLPTYSDRDGAAWNDGLMWLSTWNEYGEGTYIMPCEGLNGFGYLDAVRSVFTRGGAHTDVIPNAAEKARITHLYPQDKRVLKANGAAKDLDDPTVTLKINGIQLAIGTVPSLVANGTAFFPFDPEVSMIGERLYTTYDYDYSRGRLTLYRADGTTVSFQSGSANANVNGQAVALGGTVFTIDNIPLLPVEGLASAFGFTCTHNGNDYEITTPEYAAAHLKDDEKNGLFDFTVPGNMHSFTSYSTVMSHTGEALKLVSTYHDPSFMSPSGLSFACEDYPYMDICLRYDNAESSTLGVYFMTAAAPGTSDARYVGVPIAKSSDGEYTVVRVDLASNSAYRGTLMQFRLDMCECAGTSEIRYIRLTDGK